MKKILIIYKITNLKNAKKIALNLIKNNIANCISILKNIESIYYYRNKICKKKEYKLLIKTDKKYKYKIFNYINNKFEFYFTLKEK